ncbi:MAG TPA: PP2C family serine/threonine-protein phosphatase [Archangium sp.]|nr:PP2C family serine/threonine-protein phosphatase [Archangium sp.]
MTNATWRLDAYGYGQRGAQRQMEDAHGFSPAAGCFVVADGLGQGQGGAEAAHVAVAQVLESCSGVAESRPMAAARHAVSRAGVSVERVRGPGTTVAHLVLREGLAALVWCGDSLAYRLRRTEHGTWHWSLLNAAHRDGTRTLTRHLGSKRGGDSTTPEYRETDAKPGDVFALVTDGVWESLGHEGVVRTMMDAHPALNARWIAEELVHRALERGSEDNATALVVRVADV